MGHYFVLQLLKPLVQLHVVLIGAGVIILPSPCFSPVRLCELECTRDFAVQCAVPVACLTIKANCENAWLHAQLQNAASFWIGWAQNTFLTLITSRCSA